MSCVKWLHTASRQGVVDNYLNSLLITAGSEVTALVLCASFSCVRLSPLSSCQQSRMACQFICNFINEYHSMWYLATKRTCYTTKRQTRIHSKPPAVENAKGRNDLCSTRLFPMAFEGLQTVDCVDSKRTKCTASMGARTTPL